MQGFRGEGIATDIFLLKNSATPSRANLPFFRKYYMITYSICIP